MNKLDDLRLEIDKIDNEIIELLDNRFEIIKEVKLYKQKHGLEKLDQARFDSMVKNLRKKSKGLGVDPNMIEEIWRTIHKYSLKSQQ